MTAAEKAGINDQAQMGIVERHHLFAELLSGWFIKTQPRVNFERHGDTKLFCQWQNHFGNSVRCHRNQTDQRKPEAFRQIELVGQQFCGFPVGQKSA